MKRRSRAGGKASKARGREALKTKRRDASKTASSSAPTKDAEVARLNRELREAHEQQAATSEVLQVISSSPGDLEPVFAAMLEKAVRICDAKFGSVYRCDADTFRFVAMHNAPAALAEQTRHSLFRPSAKHYFGRMIATKAVTQVADLMAEQGYIDRRPEYVASVELGGVRAYLMVPILKERELIGAFIMGRQEVRPFTDKQIELVQNFAAQAVIAIENARLLNELRQSLEQQTATAEVLRVISSSPGDLEPVFDSMLEHAARICGANFGNIFRWDGDALHLIATHNTPPALADTRRRSPLRPHPNGPFDRVLKTRTAAHIPDLAAEPTYLEQRVPSLVVAVELGGIRTVLLVPMLKENELIGVFSLYRQEVRPFTDKQIALVTNFAAQAVIAIENARLLNELRQRTNDLSEALEQQTATSDVLQVISSSPGDLDLVFTTMLEKAVQICDAKYGTLYLPDDGRLRLVAAYDVPEFFAARGGVAFDPAPGGGLDEALRAKRPVQIPDLAATKSYIERHPGMVEAVELAGIRTGLAMPMLKDDDLIGIIAIHRREVLPFTDKQIELVKNFAAQAVIAIENTRLLNELRQRTTDLTERTTDLTEALEQQTATSEVLRVISSSAGDLNPVFDVVLTNATQICEAIYGGLFLAEGEAFRTVALHNVPPAFAEARRREPLIHARPGTIFGRVAATKELVQIADVQSEPASLSDPRAMIHLAGVRTLLIVPMIKDDELVGAVGIFRQEVRPFTGKQVELVKNFAAQAVIAIENARLLNELRQRTDDLSQRTTDLTEALEQQTATSEVLQVISGSPGDLQPVFAAMLDNAARICDANFGNIFRWDGDALWLVATHNTPPAFAEHRRRVPFRPSQGNPIGDMLSANAAIHVADLAADERYIERRDPEVVAAVELGGIRTFVAVPMLKDKKLIGAVIVYRQEVRPFSDKQIELVKNFGAQAVIAIENARLLNELRQSLEQQTATADVLRVVSRSTFDLQTVLKALVETAARLCNASMGCIVRPQGSYVQFMATFGFSQDFIDVASSTPIAPGRWTLSGRVMEEGRTVHIHDVLADTEYTFTAAQQVAGFRSGLGVPLMREGTPIGVINLWRSQVEPFTEKQIELVTTFAAQAVIAIENTRLLKELRDRTEEVETLNQHLEQRVADQVGEIERMSRLRRFLPPQVADLIVASGTEKQLESHRREITALFCDLRGFTGFSESADPEDVMTVLREYHEALGASIIKYSGTLERYAGDGVMVVFNDPVPVENPALQAVLMALEMRDAIGALTETWRRWGHDIGFGIGIAHGFATLGTIGFEGRFDYAAIGTVSNVASRLCDEAKPGQILISPRVLTKVENAVKVEPVGEFALKGIRRPLAAYNVVAASPSKV